MPPGRLAHRRFDPLHSRYPGSTQPRRLDDAGTFLKLGADLLDFVPRQRLPSSSLFHAQCSGRKTFPIERMSGLGVIRSFDNGR
jgi:hypothetical protein